MSEILSVMKWPLVACLILPPPLVYFGLHIIRCEVIFVDLALAQAQCARFLEFSNWLEEQKSRSSSPGQ